MGQYGNQPDFGTIATAFNNIGVDVVFPPSAIYIGTTENNDGTAAITMQIVGNQPGVTTTITGISSGTILPFIATKIIGTSGVDSADIILYR